MPSLEDAIVLATLAHHGRKDEAGQPYILHPLRVMFRLKTPLERMAGVLHDALENSSLSPRDLRKWGYPAEVLAALRVLTPSPRQGFKEYIIAIKKDPLARRVKLADLADHLEVLGPDDNPGDRARRERFKKARAFLLGK
ncbi:MAG: GTP pyrophosphokinase [Pseudomonadota bacterium]